MNRILYAIRNATIGFIAGVLVFFALQVLWWRFAPYPTAQILTPIAVLNPDKKITRGEKLKLFLVIDKRSDYTPQVSRNVLCGKGVYFVQPNTPGAVARPQGKYTAETSYVLPNEIPLNTPCTFIFQNEYKVNPVRTINKSWASEPFEVIE